MKTNWPHKVVDNFEELTQERLQTLVDEPLIGKASAKNKAVRYIILTKHNKLYYTITDKAVIVLNILDTRQNPSKNKYEKGL